MKASDVIDFYGRYGYEVDKGQVSRWLRGKGTASAMVVIKVIEERLSGVVQEEVRVKVVKEELPVEPILVEEAAAEEDEGVELMEEGYVMGGVEGWKYDGRLRKLAVCVDDVVWVYMGYVEVGGIVVVGGERYRLEAGGKITRL